MLVVQMQATSRDDTSTTPLPGQAYVVDGMRKSHETQRVLPFGLQVNLQMNARSLPLTIPQSNCHVSSKPDHTIIQSGAILWIQIAIFCTLAPSIPSVFACYCHKINIINWAGYAVTSSISLMLLLRHEIIITPLLDSLYFRPWRC